MTQPWQRQIKGLLKMGGQVTIEELVAVTNKSEQEIQQYVVNELGATISEEGLIEMSRSPGETVPKKSTSQEENEDEYDPLTDDDHPIWDGAFEGP